MTRSLAATLAGVTFAFGLSDQSGLARAATRAQPPARSARTVPPPRTQTTQPPSSPAPIPVPLVAGADEIPALEHDAVAPALGTSLPRCLRCDRPAWPSPVTERWRFRLHIVLDPSGKVGTVRIVQTLVGDPAARPVGVEGHVAPALSQSASARAGLAVLGAARQWRFAEPANAPLLLVTDVGVDDDVLGFSGPGQAEPASTPTAVRVGGPITAPLKLVDVPPVYPPDAVAARITGVVTIEAVIDADGNVTSARVLKGVPMLDDAALAAVRQWKYTPTVVDGMPVSVIMTVTSTFSLR